MLHASCCRIVAVCVLAAQFVVAGPAAEVGKAPSTRPADGTNAQAIPPVVTFCGSEGKGARVVFLCDVIGGELKHPFDLLRARLRESIDALAPSQSFNVTFLQGNLKGQTETGMLPATPNNKRRAREFIDTYSPRVFADPVPVLKTALKTEPDLIYFVIQPSDFPDKPGILELMREANTRQTIKLHTVAVIDRDAEDEKFLKQLAAENGGTFKYVSEDDLTKPAHPSASPAR